MKTTLLLASALSAAAFPQLSNRGLSDEVSQFMQNPQGHALAKRQEDALGISAAQSNCGTRACPTFDEKDQRVSVSGEHQWIAPGPGDIRGPCPGLNAAANHGYLPRNGIQTIEQTVSGLGALYNLGPRISAVLAVYAIATGGNPVEGVWSIGGPLPTDELTSPLLTPGQGLSYSHNTYEGDSSIGRGDAYINNGDAHSLNVTRFEKVYNIAVEDGTDRYTLDKFRAKFEEAQDESIANNPYYFTGAFSTVVVVPAAYNFVINLMSNHSAEQPLDISTATTSKLSSASKANPEASNGCLDKSGCLRTGIVVPRTLPTKLRMSSATSRWVISLTLEPSNSAETRARLTLLRD